LDRDNDLKKVKNIEETEIIPNLPNKIKIYIKNKEKKEIKCIEKYKKKNKFLHYIYTEWDKGNYGSILEYKMKLKPELDQKARLLRYNLMKKKL